MGLSEWPTCESELITTAVRAVHEFLSDQTCNITFKIQKFEKIKKRDTCTFVFKYATDLFESIFFTHFKRLSVDPCYQLITNTNTCNYVFVFLPTLFYYHPPGSESNNSADAKRRRHCHPRSCLITWCFYWLQIADLTHPAARFSTDTGGYR